MTLQQSNYKIAWFRFLVLVFVVAQFADILTTIDLVAVPGLREANPLMATAMREFGGFWWLPKFGIVVSLLVFAWRHGSSRVDQLMFATYVAVLGSLAIVGNNFLYY